MFNSPQSSKFSDNVLIQAVSLVLHLSFPYLLGESPTGPATSICEIACHYIKGYSQFKTVCWFSSNNCLGLQLLLFNNASILLFILQQIYRSQESPIKNVLNYFYCTFHILNPFILFILCVFALTLLFHTMRFASKFSHNYPLED